jgi:hypothetical protein
VLVCETAAQNSAGTQAPPPPAASPKASQSDLEKLAMPIALHPDPLISILLPASAYPLEIVQAARFVRDTNNIAKLDQQPWDENVKAVARFPELIRKMDEDISWTIALGDAFLNQPKELMDTIQALRSKARKAGTLQSTPQQVVTVTNVVVLQTNVTQVVTVTNEIVQVRPADPQIVYVPTYPATVYYPPPAYIYDPYAPLIGFGVGIAVGAIIANNCDWHHGGIYVGHHGVVAWGGGYHGDVDIDIDNVNIDRDNRQANRDGSRAQNTGARPTQQKWQPDQNRLRSSGAPATVQSREARGWGGGAQPSTRPASGTAARPSQTPAQSRAGAPGQTSNWSQSPSASQQPTRSATPAQGGSAAARPTTTWQQHSSENRANTGNRASTYGGAGQRSSASQPSFNAPAQRSASAFGGMSSGASARSAGTRGASSRGGSRGGGRR